MFYQKIYAKYMLLMALGCIIVGSCTTNNHDESTELLQEVERWKKLYDELEGKYNHELLADQTIMNDLKLTNTEGKEVFLSEVLKNDYTLVFYFAENSCSPCIDDYLAFLSHYDQEKGKENIIVISNYENTRPMIVKKTAHHSKIPHFISKAPMGLPFNTTDRTAFFVLLSKELKVNFPRYATVQDTISTLYFDKVLNFDN